MAKLCLGKKNGHTIIYVTHRFKPSIFWACLLLAGGEPGGPHASHGSSPCRSCILTSVLCPFSPQLAVIAHALVHKTNVEMGVAHVSTTRDYLDNHFKNPCGKLLHRTCLPAEGGSTSGWRGTRHHGRGSNRSLEGREKASTLKNLPLALCFALSNSTSKPFALWEVR